MEYGVIATTPPDLSVYQTNSALKVALFIARVTHGDCINHRFSIVLPKNLFKRPASQPPIKKQSIGTAVNAVSYCRQLGRCLVFTVNDCLHVEAVLQNIFLSR